MSDNTDRGNKRPIRPITEGYIEKGGINPKGRFNRRPPPPAAMKPPSSSNSNEPKPQDK